MKNAADRALYPFAGHGPVDSPMKIGTCVGCINSEPIQPSSGRCIHCMQTDRCGTGSGVPEPATAGLLAITGLGLLMRRTRRNGSPQG